MFRIKLAGHIFDIDGKYPYTERLCKDYICEGAAETAISVTDKEILAEDRNGENWSPAYLECLAIYRKICEYLIDSDIVLFHCSALAIDGKAYLFTAPSGTGKSTHTRLWRESFGSRVTMINDDKPLLRITDSAVTVYGTPYGGKDNIQTNTSAEVGAVVIIHQAAENIIKKISAAEAYPMLLNQTYRPDKPDKMIKTMDLVRRISELPVYSMGCNISRAAALLAYKTLKGE